MSHTHRPHKVYVRQYWADDWEEIPYLYADEITWAIRPNTSQVQLFYRFGTIQRPDENTKAPYSPQELDQWYVKIEVDQGDSGGELPVANPPRVWHGIIVDEILEEDGDEDGQQRTGRQHLVALGLEFLLTRVTIDFSWVAVQGDDPKRIERAIGFNLGQGHDDSHVYQPNRSFLRDDNEVFIFANTLDDGPRPWTSRQICEYLLMYHVPVDVGGEKKLTWQLEDDSELEYLDFEKPALRVQGATPDKVLDRLIDRRRGATWCVVVDDDDVLNIRVATFAKTAVELPGGGTIPANGRQKTFYFADEGRVWQSTIGSRSQHVADEVIARGQRITSTGTFGPVNEDLVQDWEPEDESAYNAGGDTTGITDILEVQDLHQLYRRQDKFARVYRHLRIPETFTSDVLFIHPETEDPLEFWAPGLRCLPYLPLHVGEDYSGEELPDDTDSLKEFRRPLAFVKDPDSDPERWYQLDKLATGARLDRLIESGGVEWAASIAVQDDRPGIIINVTGGPQHLIAAEDFAPADDFDAADYQPDLAWQDILATVCLEADAHVEGRWPDALPPSPADITRTITVDVPDARADYLVPFTILEIDDAGQQVEAEGGWIRNDTERLTDIARAAWEWYQTPRRSLAVQIHTLDGDLEIGDLITTANSENNPTQINSLVTQISLYTRDGSQVVHAQFAEMDFAGGLG